MPRPTKCRRICRYPQVLEFRPGEDHQTAEPVILTLDEFEAIRLIDKMGLSQEQCSACLQIARTTAQKIYESARRKIAQALVEGRTLRIEGGDYRICDGRDPRCGLGLCKKRQIEAIYDKPKGEWTMRIAVTYDNGQVFQHFGRTEAFKLYDVENGKVVSCEVVSTNGNGHSALADMLCAMRVDTLICGGIGAGAQMALRGVGVALYGGVTGEADAAVQVFLAGELNYQADIRCDHHDHHHGEGHECGEHGCGGHHCGGH